MSKPPGNSGKDYARDGIDIQTAMVRDVEDFPSHFRRPRQIAWDGEPLWTSFEIAVPEEGRFRVEFLSVARESLQGVDVDVEDGGITLPSGKSVKTLRSWHDPRYEPAVEYPYHSKSGSLKVWNVYHWTWPKGLTTEERWTGNAGFRVEKEGGGCWVFRCSDGPSTPPDFGRLVFRLSISEGQHK